jgi:hypothetical protein
LLARATKRGERGVRLSPPLNFRHLVDSTELGIFAVQRCAQLIAAPVFADAQERGRSTPRVRFSAAGCGVVDSMKALRLSTLRRIECALL